jgi:hypothetical protein
MSIESQIEREERFLEEEYDNGNISLKEFNRQMAELRADYRACAEEAAQEARDMENW